jgi:hypothetical protein
MAALSHCYDGDNPEDVTDWRLVTAESPRYDDANGRRSRASIASGMDVKGRAKGFASVPGFVGDSKNSSQRLQADKEPLSCVGNFYRSFCCL